MIIKSGTLRTNVGICEGFYMMAFITACRVYRLGFHVHGLRLGGLGMFSSEALWDLYKVKRSGIFWSWVSSI